MLGVDMNSTNAGDTHVSWWDDLEETRHQKSKRHAVADRHVEQTEFWSEHVSVADTDIQVEKATLSKKKKAHKMERVKKIKKLADEASSIARTTYAERPRFRALCHVAQYLNISDTIYDGRDDGRWFQLPRRKHNPSYPLISEASLTNVYCNSAHELLEQGTQQRQSCFIR